MQNIKFAYDLLDKGSKMKKIVVLLSFLLSGCLFPAYYGHDQEITFQVPPGAQVEYVGAIIDTPNNYAHFKVYRSWEDKEVVIKKKGYKDYHLKLSSSWSDEKWAKWEPLLAGAQDKSGAWLMTPYNTFYILAHTFEEPPVLLCLPVTLVLDVYNIVIGGPSTALLNPWKQYYYETNIKMEPLKSQEN